MEGGTYKIRFRENIDLVITANSTDFSDQMALKIQTEFVKKVPIVVEEFVKFCNKYKLYLNHTFFELFPEQSTNHQLKSQLRQVDAFVHLDGEEAIKRGLVWANPENELFDTNFDILKKILSAHLLEETE